MQRQTRSMREWGVIVAVLLLFLYLFTHSGLLAQVQEFGAPSESQQQPSSIEDQAITATEEEEQEEGQPIAFDHLPKTQLGYVDWVKAITENHINPKESLDPDFRPMPPINFNVAFQIEGDTPDVIFPHFPHTIWLDCRNCHPAIFKMQAGTNPVTMDKILRGEFCGRCHGIVAFPISDCKRCHSKPK